MDVPDICTLKTKSAASQIPAPATLLPMFASRRSGCERGGGRSCHRNPGGNTAIHERGRDCAMMGWSRRKTVRQRAPVRQGRAQEQDWTESRTTQARQLRGGLVKSSIRNGNVFPNIYYSTTFL